MEKFLPLDDNQIRVLNDTALIYEGYLVAHRERSKYPGWMYFKPKQGNEYLFHATDRKGNGRSLGRRSDETERTMNDFRAAKDAAEERFNGLAKRMHDQARFCKAARINRLPAMAGKIIRTMERLGVADNFVVVGTNALYAYESEAGIAFLPEVTATADMDILWDSKRKLTFAVQPGGEETPQIKTFMELLRSADKLFTVNTERTFQAINGAGFAVELLKPLEPAMPFKAGEGDQLTPMPLRGQDWLLLRPPVKRIVIGNDGYPLFMRVPDPRLFCLHKAWLSTLDDRNPDKKQRDLAQGQMVAQLLSDRLAAYPLQELLDTPDLPAELRQAAPLLAVEEDKGEQSAYF